MAKLTITAEINGSPVTVVRDLGDAGDAPALAWCEAAYPGTEDAPLTGEGSVEAAIIGVMRGVLDNINRHAVEQAKAAAEANAAQITV